MAVTYTTAAKVSSLMRLIDPTDQSRLTFDTDTDPTLAEVEAAINRAEDRIDKETNHAWRAVTVTDEYYDLLCDFGRFYKRQYAIHLKHRKINELVSGTDKIEIWDGSAWVDLVLDANGYTEGRGGDYWVDYNQGIIYLVNKRPWVLENGIRVSYRYGEASVPGDIETACTKLAAIEIAETNDYVVTLPDGVSEYGISSKVDKWQSDVDKILDKRRELITA